MKAIKKWFKTSKYLKSLRFNLGLTFIILITLSLLIFNSLNIYFRIQTQDKVIDSQLELIAQKASDPVGNFILNRFNELESGIRLGNLGTVNLEEKRLILDRLIGLEPAFRQLILLDNQGNILDEVSRISRYSSSQISDLKAYDLFLEAYKEKRYISSVYIDNTTNEPLVIMSVPVIDIFDNYYGLLLAEVNLKFMWDLVGSIKVGNTGISYVADSHGNLIAFGDTSRVLKGEKLTHLDEVCEFIGGNYSIHETNSRLTKGILGDDVFTTHVNLGNPNWAVFVELPIEEAYRDFNHELGMSILLILLCIFLAVLFSIFISGRISKPLIKLRDATKLIRDGKFDTNIAIKSNNEIGELANSFNIMIKDLRESRKKLEEYNKNLEKMVEERTKELKISKDELEKSVKSLILNKKALTNIMDDLNTTVNDLRKAKEEIENKNIDLGKTHKILQELNINLEKKVLERTKEIQNLLKQKDEFINQLGHDLKNPLNPLVNLLPLVEKREKDPKSKEMLQVINRNINYMKNLVVKTIELASLNSSGTEFNIKVTNVLDQLNSVIEKNKLLFYSNKIKIRNKIDSDLYVKADELRLEELFENLVNNAVKYSPKGGNIIIDAKKNEGFVTVSIKDSGQGMSKKQIEHIFEEFYKADSSRHDFDSSGLGLPICKRIVERHGGRIWVESEGISKGATIFFTLPLV